MKVPKPSSAQELQHARGYLLRPVRSGEFDFSSQDQDWGPPYGVIPAQAGIQLQSGQLKQKKLDSRLRGNDNE